jgi:hypothetical protein
VNTTLTQAIDRKAQARRDWQGASFDEKIAALIRMQEMAQEMALAAGRPFKGIVWKPGESHETRR